MLCECTSLEERRASRPVGGADHTTYVELCWCCGLVLLRSGSRWSTWICEACRPLVDALNGTVGSAVVPIGRHSVHAGIMLADAESANRAAVEAFHARSTSYFDRVGQFQTYARDVVAHNVRQLGFEPGTDVPVAKYLARIERSELRAEHAFVRLLFGFALVEEAA